MCRSDRGDVEVRPGLDAGRLEGLHPLGVGGGRGVVLHQPRDPAEERAGIHRLHALKRRSRAGLGGRRNLRRGAPGRAPGAERRERVLLLQRGHRRALVRPVRLHLPVNPDIARRGPVRLGDAGGRRALPAGAGDQEVGSRRSRGALADRGEDVAPHVEQRDDVVAAAGVRHGEHERLFVEIRPRHREQRVEPGSRHRPERGVRIVRHHREPVRWGGDLPDGRCRRRFPREVHHHQREAVDVGLRATKPRQQPETGHGARLSGGGVHEPSRIDGGVSCGQ